MKILVTGGRGQLGHALGRVFGADALLAGHKELDVTSVRQVGNVMDRIRPDVVIHAAAWTNVDACEKDEGHARHVNMNGTQHVAMTAARCKARLVVISTDYVFAGKLGRPLTEDDAPNPATVYGGTKLAAEGAAIFHHPSPIILRTCGLYGETGRHFPGVIASRIRAGEPLRVVSDQVVSPTYTLDLAEAIARILEWPDASGVYHASNAGAATWHEVAREIAALLGAPDHPIQPIESTTLNRVAPPPPYSALDCSKLQRDLKVVLRPWDQALRRFWENSDGALA